MISEDPGQARPIPWLLAHGLVSPDYFLLFNDKHTLVFYEEGFQIYVPILRPQMKQNTCIG